MLFNLVILSIGFAGGYYVPSLVKKWFAGAEQYAKDVEKKL